MADHAPRRSSVETVRVAALDVAHSHRRSTVVVGPLRLPSLADLNDRFDAMARHGASTRLSLEPSVTSTRWRLGPSEPPAVVETPPLPPDGDPTTLVARVRSAHDQRGIAVITAGDYLAIDFSHGLGEVFFIHSLLDSMLGANDPADPATWSRYRHTVSPLLVAASRTFAKNPRKIVELVALQRNRARLPMPGVDAQAVPRPPAPATCTVGLPADVVAGVRRYRDASLPGISLVALFTHALWRTLAETGVTMSPLVKVPFDARRYLPRTRDTLATFSAGLDFVVDPLGGPAQLQAAMKLAAHSGRPVANLMLGTLTARRRIWQRSDRDHVVPAGPIQLLHSNVGDIPRTDSWPFSDRAQARLLVASDPADVNAITVTSATTLGNMWFTAEFHSTAISADVVAATLRSVAEQAASDSLAVS
jgi:hypothetical protein